MSDLSRNLININSILLPRILTQVCRDKFSPLYGSFDRNWWHYKIRDFSSLILQQGGYAIYCYYKDSKEYSSKNSIFNLIKASAIFWNKQAESYGAFEEYYPWEKGYPPLAFSTLAIAKLVQERVVDFDEVSRGMKVAAKQLLNRFESEASNQQIAGLAALGVLKKIAPELVNQTIFDKLSDRSLKLQNKEGWFYEYGGPDLGYLSVTLDCLWDLYDFTGDKSYIKSASRSLDFIYKITSSDKNNSIGILNSRNTDYITPYGIARFLKHDNKKIKNKASILLHNLFSNISKNNHFLYAIDDRYLCHYIGHSFFRTSVLLKNSPVESFNKYKIKKDIFFDESGFLLLMSEKRSYTALVSCKKGGSLTLNFSGKKCSDFGWVLKHKNKTFVSNWWGDFWEIEKHNNFIKIKGFLTKHKENISNPFKHFCLRILSFLFGEKVIPILKELIIFKFNSRKAIPFTREIYFNKEVFKIIDTIQADKSFNLYKSNRSSQRHVASANSFNSEDFKIINDRVKVKELLDRTNKMIKVISIYRNF